MIASDTTRRRSRTATPTRLNVGVGTRRSFCPERWLADHGDVLFRYAYARVRDQHVAEDLVQETLLSAWRGCHAFGGKSSERTWLVGILKHKLFDHWRQVNRQMHALQQRMPGMAGCADPLEDVFDADGKWRGPPAPWPEPEAAFEQQEFWHVLADCIASLPPAQAQAFRLRELDGRTPDAVCKILKVTPANLWVLLHRARVRLRQGLEQRWFQFRHSN